MRSAVHFITLDKEEMTKRFALFDKTHRGLILKMIKKNYGAE
jgi:Ca2+-binding EF-hand superfamily protein